MGDHADGVDEAGSPASAGTPSVRRRGGQGPWGTLLVPIVGVLLVTAAAWVLLAGQTYRPPTGTQVAAPLGTATADGAVLQHVALHFDVYPYANGSVGGVPVHPGGNRTWPTISPTSNFQVPAHALVTVTVRQYDAGAALNDPWFANVRGTVGDVATVDGRSVHAVDPNSVGHTFLLQSLPGAATGYFLNVPLPAVHGPFGDGGAHHTVVFSFVSGPKGTYAWNCEFPCGQMIALFGSAMSTTGYMSGYLHAV